MCIFFLSYELIKLLGNFKKKNSYFKCYFNLYHGNVSLKSLNGFLSSRGRIGSCTVQTQGAAVQRGGGGINVLQDHQRGFLLHG